MAAERYLLDSRFLSSVYKLAIAILLLGSVLLVPVGVTAVTGFAAAGVLSLLLLVAQERMIRALLAQHHSGSVRKFIWLSVLKYLGVFVVIGLLLRYQAINPIALCVGILLVPVSICLRAAVIAIRVPWRDEAREN